MYDNGVGSAKSTWDTFLFLKVKVGVGYINCRKQMHKCNIRTPYLSLVTTKTNMSLLGKRLVIWGS